MGVENRRGLYLPDGTFRPVKPKPDSGVSEKILKERGVRSLEELATDLGVGVEVVQATIDYLRREGYGIRQEGGVVVRTTSKNEGGSVDLSEVLDRYLHFGIVSDTHLASKKERLDALEAMYDVFEREGVRVVFHVGDLTDGWGVYRGQEFELKHFGQAEQIEYAVGVYPKREGITTYFITGNHDLRQYERGGVDPGVPVARQRADMEYLGQITAKVLLPEGAEMELLHPGGGVAYALSYKAQKYINNLAPEDIPNILVFGHYHTSFYMHYRNVHFLQAPCFKDAGLWEKRLGINPTIGGWVVDAVVSPDSGRVRNFRPALFSFGQRET